MGELAGDRISYKIDIDGLSQLDGMRSTIKQIEKLMPGLSKSVRDAQQSIKRMNSSMSDNSSERSINQQRRQYDGLVHNVNTTTHSVETLDRTMTRVGSKNHFAKQSRDLNQLGSRIQSFGVKATAMTAGITAGAAMALKMSAKLQNRYRVITNLAVTGGEKSAEAQRNVNAMQRDGTKYSNQYGVAQSKIAAGYETLIRRGYTTNQALGAQKSYLQGAIASGDSYADVIDSASSAIEQFGMKVNSVKGMALASKTAVNQMAYSADMTAASMQGLGESLKYAGPDAHAAHQSLHTTVAAIGELSNFGIKDSQAGTSMRQIYQRLLNPPAKGKAPNAMEKIGLSYKDFRDAKNELMPIQDIFGLLSKKMKGMSKSDKGGIYAALFGANASAAANALGESYKQVDALDKKVAHSQNMNHGEGYAAQLSKKNLGSLQSQWNRIKRELQNGGVAIANAWMPALTKLAGVVADLLGAFNKLPKSAQKFIGGAIAITALVGPMALVAGSLVKMNGAMKNIAKLAGESGEGESILGTVTDFLGVGSRKGAGKTGSRSAKTHFSNSARVPGSLAMSGFDWRKTGRNISKAKTWMGNTRVGRKLSPVTSRVASVGHGVKSLPRTLWSDAKEITKGGLRNGKSLLGKIPGMTRTGKIAKGGFKLAGKVASKIPVLDIAMAGTNLIGMNKKNAGKKVGATGGMLAGGAIGSLLGPIGGIAGAAIGQTLGSKLGSTIQKTIPKKMMKSLTSAFKGIGKTFNNLLKPFKSVIKSIAKVWSTSTKGISKSWNKYVVKPLSGKAGGNAVKTAAKIFKAILIPTMKLAGAAFKVFGAVVKTAIKVVARVITGLIKTISGVFKLVNDAVHGRWKTAWKDAVQIFSDIFGTIKGILSDILGSVWDGIKDFGSKIGGFVKHPVKTVKGWFGDGKKHASGTTRLPHLGAGVRTDEHAIVNDGGGRELVIYPNGQAVLPKGRNTHMFLPKGSNVLNASDTRHLLGNSVVHHAKGTTKLRKGATKVASVNFDVSKSVKSLGKLQKGSKKQWSSISKDTDKRTKKLQKNTVNSFDKTQKDSLVQMKQMHKGMNAVTKDMVEDFYKIFSKLDNYAHKAMSNAIKQLNGGIRGINTVLNKFGGGGDVLPLIHYAQGSKGPISKHTMAVVNDATSGPRQETIVAPNGRAYMPQGDNAVVPLGPGYEVLNGTETAQLQAVGALPHYAKGTGGLHRLIENSNKNPKNAWKRDFTSNLKGSLASSLGRGLAKTSKGASNSVGLPWNAEVWSQLQNAMSGGGAGGNWAHTPGSGWSTGGNGQNFGDTAGRGFQHDGVDFGAKLGTPFHAVHGGTVTRAGNPVWAPGALGKVITVKSDDGWQEIYQEFGGMKNIKVSVGDVVKTGQTLGTLGPLNGAGSGAHLHIGVSHGSLWDHGGTSTKGWFDLTKMHGKSDGSAKKDKKSKNPALTKLVKSELGNRLKWVSDKLGEDSSSVGSIGGQPKGGYSSLIRKAAEAMHATIPGGKWMSYMLGMIKNESGGNAKIKGIDDHDGTGAAMGLLQYKRSTFNAYAMKGHKNILSAWDQLLAFFNNSHYKTDIGIGYNGKVGEWRGNASGPSGHRRFANGGWAKNGAVNIFGEAKGENEVAVNTSRPSADPLLVEAMSDRAMKSPSGIFGQMRSFMKAQAEFKKMNASRTKFNADMKASSVSGKQSATIKPTINYKPTIIIQGTTDAKGAGTEVAKALTQNNRDFAAMMEAYCNMALSNQ